MHIHIHRQILIWAWTHKQINNTNRRITRARLNRAKFACKPNAI